MILSQAGQMLDSTGIPHASGGDPFAASAATTAGKYSPRKWG
ncbi:hypothetical protein HMPREF9264_0721 [Lactobacillus delbrueckii subsp. bulgaricus PB2003/044-T3-4]|nr:hypothetical protein HMPREF9264_0721 [Lactobacillus delbrueckii subsp. bulgaricus PB2003/044-T3-4]